jgi:hypothetical protein
LKKRSWVGGTGGKVETRNAGADKDATYPLAGADIVATYKLFNLNRTKLTASSTAFLPPRS